MPHIHTGPGEHDDTASAYIVRLDFDEPKLMLHRHRLLGKYLQFGGHIELVETPWLAIEHEVEEEAGYKLSELKILQPPSRLQTLTNVTMHPYPVASLTHEFEGLEDHKHTDLAYAFVAYAAPRQKPHGRESQDIVCFSRQELAGLGAADIYKNVKEIALYVLDVCLADWEQVDTKVFSA